MSELSNRIKELRAQGKSYREIQAELSCSRSTISYHLADGQKDKTKKRTESLRLSNSLLRKSENFQTKGKSNKVTHFHIVSHGRYGPQKFTWKDVEEHIGDEPVCYLTGDPIDLNNPKSYSFDHIVPRSRGGTNDISNLGITTRMANMAKTDMDLEEFIDLCVKVAKNFDRL